MYFGRADKAVEYLQHGVDLAPDISFVQLSAADSLAQLALFTDDCGAAQRHLDQCAALIASQDLPARSWYDLAHQVTRAAFLERREDWEGIVDLVDQTEPEIARRQFRALRTTLLAVKARALAELGLHRFADATLAAAVRACPRGAVDPLIVLEASKGYCRALRDDVAEAAVHFDRALTGCRAIGHRYHEQWIERARERTVGPRAAAVPAAARKLTASDAALILSDVAAVLGAGHSIDLLAQRLIAILRATVLDDRVDVVSESGHDYEPDPSAVCDTEADGTFRLQLRGSDRYVVIQVRDVQSIDEISLLKGVADLVEASIGRTTSVDEEDEQTLWPKATPPSRDDTVFRSPRMIELLRIAHRLASAQLPILITGETGTGKEIFARLIHDHSKSARGPFITFNCSTMPRDLVESQLFGHRRGAFTGAHDSAPGVVRSAENGTLFLDEIGDLDSAVQPKLLRFLESGEIQPVGESRPVQVKVRIVAATNAKLERLVEEGRFRSDLFYRIGTAQLALPPLRERKDEIPALAALFLERHAAECKRRGLRLSDDLIAALLMFDWPGNIRQLSNEIRRIVALAGDGDVLTSADLAPEIARPWHARHGGDADGVNPTVGIRLDQPLEQAMRDLERQFLEHALKTSGGRVAEAAQLLGLSRKGLFLKRRRQGMVRREGPQ